MKARGVLLFVVLALVVAFTGALPTFAQEKPQSQQVAQDATRKTAPMIGAEVLPPDVPLPIDIVVNPPEPQIDVKLAGFSGVWTGEWKFATFRGLATRNHVLAVERIQPRDALIVVAIGELPLIPEATRVVQASWRRVLAKVIDGAIVFTARSGAAVTYTLNSDGTITGTSVGSVVGRATLRKVAGASEPPGDVDSQPAVRNPQVVQATERIASTDEKFKPLIGKWRRVLFSSEAPENIITITGIRTDKTLEGTFWGPKIGELRLSVENAKVSIEKGLIKIEILASWYGDYELTYYNDELVGAVVPKSGPYIGKTINVILRKE